MRTRAFTALLLAAALTGAACQQPSTSSGPGGALTATLSDTAIQLSGATVDNGKVTLTVKNVGSVLHSLVVLKTNLADDKIPASSTDASKADERGKVASTGAIQAGETKQFTFDLEPGKYVLICNEPAHYIVGMHTHFEVK
jgi:uncharacterized cupredoxin-like copper-binding protein